jgi:hypothetical protein
MTYRTRFERLSELGTLPWFSSYEDRVVLKDRSIGPIIDVHTHVALAYLRPMQLDLMAAHDHTEHYLPSCCAVDLDVYANRNFSPKDLGAMKSDLTWNSVTDRGMRRTHTVPNLLREMDELGIERSVILPIDFPILSDNASHAIFASEKDPRCVAFGSVHPYAPNARDRLDAQVQKGVRGIKVHPAVQCVRPDDPRAMRLYKMCADRDLIVLWHCGPVNIEPRLGRYLSQVKFYEKPIAENPRTKFILGHAGALQLDQALALVRRYSNVYLETSSQSLSGVRTILDGVPEERVLFGTDWPFYHQAMGLAKVLIATHDRPERRHQVLHGNATRLLGLA